MKQSNVLRRGMSALVALVLLVGMAMGQNDFVIVSGGSISNSGTIKVKGNITNSGVAGATTIAGTVQLKANAAQSIGTASNGAINFSTLTIPASGGNTKTFNVNSTVAAAIDIAASAGANSSYSLGSNTLTLQGTIANTGGATTPYVFSSGTVDYNGADDQTVWGSSGFTYGSLTVSQNGDKTMNGDITVSTALSVSAGNLSIGANTLTVNGTYSISDSITGSASSNMVLGGTGNIASFIVYGGLGDLTLNRDTYNVTLGDALTVNGALALNNGTLAVSTQTLTLLGAVTAAGSGALSSATTGTVAYNKGTNVQAVLAANYGNLTFSNFTKTLPSGTVGVAGTFTPGSATGHTITGNTFDFNGGTQTIPAFNAGTGYQNLFTSGAASEKTASGSLEIAGNFDNGGGSDNAVTLVMGLNSLTIGGTKDNTASTIKFAGASNGQLFTTGTIDYNGTVTQTIAGGGDYSTLALSGSGTKQIASGVTVGANNSLTVPTGVTLQLVDGTSVLNLKTTASLTVEGTLTNAGTIDVGN